MTSNAGMTFNFTLKHSQMFSSLLWSGLCSFDERHGENRAEDGGDCRTAGAELGW